LRKSLVFFAFQHFRPRLIPRVISSPLLPKVRAAVEGEIPVIGEYLFVSPPSILSSFTQKQMT
jgi:hypothetical protein